MYHKIGTILFMHFHNHYNIMNTATRQLVAQQHLKNKTIVITGASSGVGRAAALAFARCTPKLVLAGRRSEALEEVAVECRESGASVLVVPTDVTKAGEVQQLAKAANDFGGRIDVWVNNAGVLAAGAFDQTPIDIHEQVIRTNLMGYVHGAHAVLPYFKQQKEGILINNISVGGWMPVPYGAAYSASKFGLRGFSEALNGELGRWPDIHVCELYPAFLDTPGIQHAANYTGRNLKPAPPVYDPIKVADAMVELAVHPRRKKIVGAAATALRLGHFLFPGLIVSMTAKVMEAYFKNADPIPVTGGNVLEPVDYGTSIHGGWSLATASTAKKSAMAGLLIAGVTAGLFALTKKR
jgi:short-subunit dehydrogenase